MDDPEEKRFKVKGIREYIYTSIKNFTRKEI